MTIYHRLRLININMTMISFCVFVVILGSVQGRSKSDLAIFDNNAIPYPSSRNNTTTNSHADSYRADQRSLKRVFLSNRTITCNDGSQAGFYLRRSPGSQRWVVFFEGGWYCYDQKSCRSRWLRMRHLMTSVGWPEFREASGILSTSAKENPYWHDANHVLVPYCSSDSWTGRKAVPDSRDGWRFMGSLIVRQVIADLIPLGLSHSQGSELLMAGSSAGGLGVMMNLDKVRTYLQQERKLKVVVRGVSDSGWFLDREPYIPNAITTSEVVRQGWKLWDGVVPEACRKRHLAEPWRCYFGHRVYPTLRSPLFIFQWLFDEAQMRADSVGAPVTRQQWDFIHQMGAALRRSLDNVTAVFAPSCIGHSVLDKREWMNIKIDDISLPDAMRCWEISTENQQRRFGGRRDRKSMTKEEKELRRQLNRERQKQKRKQLGLSEGESLNEPGKKKKGHKNKKQKKKKNNNQHKKELLLITADLDEEGAQNNKNQNITTSNNIAVFKQDELNARKHKLNQRRNHDKQERERNRENKRNRAKQRRRNEVNKIGGVTSAPNHQHRHKNQRLSPRTDPKKCSLRLLEKCSWPHCNHSCPSLTNPVTGEEMRLLELLASFGLDIDAVAAALGIDMQTLKNMDHAELVNLLTQQVS